jgi:KaiC/GvpD/RAD55 family RecA-like ATPase
MKYSPASIFHEGKMIEIQRVMEKLRVDLEYHEQKIRLIKYEMVQIDLSEISVCSTSSYTEKDVEFHEDKIREVIKELKKNEKLLSDEIERMAMSQRAFDDERRNQL